eukprot:5572920-Alexandrium_andersonii.AAC.1
MVVPRGLASYAPPIWCDAVGSHESKCFTMCSTAPGGNTGAALCFNHVCGCSVEFRRITGGLAYTYCAQ